jgi:hypothetical protein
MLLWTAVVEQFLTNPEVQAALIREFPDANDRITYQTDLLWIDGTKLRYAYTFGAPSFWLTDSKRSPPCCERARNRKAS